MTEGERRRADEVARVQVELAAAAARTVPVTEVRDRLEREASLPAVRRGDVEHHRSLEAAVAWSYDRLGAPEAALLRRLPLLVGGFGHDAVRAVAGDGGAAVG